MCKVLGRAVAKADVGIQPALTLVEHDDPASVHPDVVVNRRRSAVTPVGQHNTVIADRAVIVMVMSAKHRHHIPALKHLAEKPGIQMRAANRLPVRAVRLESHAFPEGVGIFR